MTNRQRASIWLALAAIATSCGYGEGIVRVSDHTLLENLGPNRYTYRSTRLASLPPKPPAAALLVSSPPGAREVGMIDVSVSYGGFGADGLRGSEAAFFPMLAKLAGEMGGTHFMIVRSTHETRMGDWIASLTVAVLALPSGTP